MPEQVRQVKGISAAVAVCQLCSDFLFVRFANDGDSACTDVCEGEMARGTRPFFRQNVLRQHRNTGNQMGAAATFTLTAVVAVLAIVLAYVYHFILLRYAL